MTQELTVKASSNMAPSLAQQTFVIGSAVAGILGGLFLAQRLSKVSSVPTPAIALATLVSGAATFGAAVWLAKSAGGE
jgi:hypothetical protein